MPPYENEREGQVEFFRSMRLEDEIDLSDNTDGVYKGTLFEFKLTIPNYKSTLSQAVKYLSHMRMKGRSVPANIILVALNESRAYLFRAADFMGRVESVYVGAASRNNDDFDTDVKPEQIDYGSPAGLRRILEALLVEKYVPVSIDAYDVVGWADRYYRENPLASKIQLFEELRSPHHFKGLIKPWDGDESDFRHIMDLLNDPEHRKQLGAFYTPPEYCELGANLVREAVSRIPEGNDYVIIDRCAGTGGLEAALDDELLSHVIVNTFELKEWLVLNERIGDKVRMIVPPPAEVRLDSALVNGGNALEREFVFGEGEGLSEEYRDSIERIAGYVSDERCNVILYENPPYRDDVADNGRVRKSYVYEEMSKELKGLPNSNVSTARDLSNQFIWSGWKWYLTKPDDFMVLLSPLKYWKTLGLGDKCFIRGYLLNRAHFHAHQSAISLILWRSAPESVESIRLEKVDIDERTRELVHGGEMVARKCHATLEPLFDRRRGENDVRSDVYCERDGRQTSGRRCDGVSYDADDIVGYLRTDSFGVDAKHVSLTRCTLYNVRGFYLRKDNLLDKLPLFCAKLYRQSKWYERDVYFTTSDGGRAFQEDEDFKRACLIFTCLTERNKCRSFVADNGVIYKNEICFDEGSYASQLLAKFELTPDESALLESFKSVLREARNTTGYDERFPYGPFQVSAELNSRWKDEYGHVIYSYPVLNTALATLKKQLGAFYDAHIVQKLFEYELLK